MFTGVDGPSSFPPFLVEPFVESFGSEFPFSEGVRCSINCHHVYANGSARADEEFDEEEVANPDNYGQNIDLDLGDLALDEEEFPAGIEPSDFVAMATEAIMAMEELDL
ncbi:hypothetical protein B0H14DRAFT_3507300 [Mycena olivaceomarginata]|nr:hypothetical protein B0H14DRAFT_3507300 [Mycena olivaceomarginata]